MSPKCGAISGIPQKATPSVGFLKCDSIRGPQKLALLVGSPKKRLHQWGPPNVTPSVGSPKLAPSVGFPKCDSIRGSPECGAISGVPQKATPSVGSPKCDSISGVPQNWLHQEVSKSSVPPKRCSVVGTPPFSPLFDVLFFNFLIFGVLRGPGPFGHPQNSTPEPPPPPRPPHAFCRILPLAGTRSLPQSTTGFVVLPRLPSTTHARISPPGLF